MKVQIMTKLKYILICIILIICCFVPKYSFAENTTEEITKQTDKQTAEVKPAGNQYMELKATTINEIEGKDKQVIFELWSYDIEFKGFDVRFSYDGTSFATSNLSTNEYTEDETEYFAFEKEFENSLELFTVPYTGSTPDGIRAVVSFDPPITETEHIKEKDEIIGKVVDTSGGVLLGKMSFRMNSDSFDISSFKLETSNNSPETGIKINIDGKEGGNHYYEEQSVFRFTDATASKNASLANIKLSTGNEDDSTYKEYPLTPEFNKDTLEYKVELLEYVEKMDLTITKDDENSTIKIKVPKRDENGNLVYASDGTNIDYEEKEMIDLTNEITLNKLGEPDTIVTIIVTAEDGKSQKEYELVIHRPYATIKGNIIYDTIEDNENPDIIKITDLNFYETGQFNWVELQDIFGEIYDEPATYDDLDLIDKEFSAQSESDGTYEIYVIPKTYDLQIDKKGFLDYVITNILVNEGDTIDLGDITLIAGDVNRDGVIGVEDIQTLVSNMDISEEDPDYNEAYDLVQYGAIGVESVQYSVTNLDQILTIINYIDM